MTSSADSLQDGMGDMGSTNGLPDMRMYGSTKPPTAAQVEAAAKLIKETDASLVRFENVQNAIAAGFPTGWPPTARSTYSAPSAATPTRGSTRTIRRPWCTRPVSHAPILLGAMYLMGSGNGPQVGGGLTRWLSHLEVCRGGRHHRRFAVALRGHCDPSTWKDQYTTQMLHVWVVPYPGGVFSDDLSTAATTAAAKAALAETRPGQLAP